MASVFIDPHVHLFPPERLRKLVRWIRRAIPDHPVAETVGAAELVADLRQHGVTHFFNLIYPLREAETRPLNDFNIEFCRRTPGAIPFASLHPDTPHKAAYAARILASPEVVGFKLHPFVQAFDPWDRRMFPLYRFLEEIGRPLMLHTGFEAFYGRTMPLRDLAGLLDSFPRLAVVFVHAAFPELEAAFDLLADHPGLYLDLTNVLAFARPAWQPFLADLGGTRFLDRLAKGVEANSHRMLFGSDHPAGMGGLDDIYADLERFGFSADTLHHLTAGTPRRLVEAALPGFDWQACLEPEHSLP